MQLGLTFLFSTCLPPVSLPPLPACLDHSSCSNAYDAVTTMSLYRLQTTDCHSFVVSFVNCVACHLVALSLADSELWALCAAACVECLVASAAVGRPAFIVHFMANCNFHFNLRCTAVRQSKPVHAHAYCHAHSQSHLSALGSTSTVAAYNFVYNYIEIKSKTQAATAAVAASAVGCCSTSCSSCSCICWQSGKNFPPAGDTYLISSTWSDSNRCHVLHNVRVCVSVSVCVCDSVTRDGAHDNLNFLTASPAANWPACNIHKPES